MTARDVEVKVAMGDFKESSNRVHPEPSSNLEKKCLSWDNVGKAEDLRAKSQFSVADPDISTKRGVQYLNISGNGFAEQVRGSRGLAPDGPSGTWICM